MSDAGGERSEEILIRPASIEDAGSFRRCLDVVARERRYLAMLEAPPPDEVRSYLEAAYARGMVQLLALAGDEVVGWCDVDPGVWEGYRHRGTLGMGLLPAYRGRGLGRRLLRATLAAAAARGIRRVELEVYDSNEAAIGLYLAEGFRREGVRTAARILDGRVENALAMARLDPALAERREGREGGSA